MLKNSNFKNLWLGRVVSNAGDSIYAIVLSWYIITETGSLFWVGILNAAFFLPNIFSFLIGPIIDRSDKRKFLIFLEAGQLASICLVTLLVFFNFDYPILICLFVFLASLFGMNTYTVQDAYIPKIVEKEKYELAQSYMNVGNTIINNVFNAVTGFLIKYFSTVALLILNVFTFIIAIVLFKRIDKDSGKTSIINSNPENDSFKSSYKKEILDGFRYIFKRKEILIITINLTIINFFFGGLNVFIVKIASDLGSPIMLGLLNSSLAIGTVIGATYFSQKILKRLNIGSKLVFCSFGFGIMLIITSFYATTVFILIPLTIAAVFLGVTQILTHPIVQTLTPEENLGKVFSAQYTISVGIMPLGALIFGKLGENILNTDLFLIIIGIVFIFISISYFVAKGIYRFSINLAEN